MQQARRAAVTLAAWAIALAGQAPASNGSMPTSSTRTFVGTAVKAPEPVAPRVAFTEAQSRIFEVSVAQESDSEPKLWGPAESTAYSAELSAGRGAQRLAYVSTEHSDQGEVYVPTDDDGPVHVRITCNNNEAAEFHPVISPDGTMLAYASDEKGNLDIWVVPLSERPDDCPQARQLPQSTAADTWPTWSPDSSSIIFSSTREDPLGDLFQLSVPDLRRISDATSESGLIQFASGPDADTQPAVYRRSDEIESSGSTWVAFTTTPFEQSRSLVVLALPPAGARKPQVFPLWPPASEPGAWLAQGYGSSEAVWSPYGDRIAFTIVVEGLPKGAPVIFAWSKGIPPDSTAIKHDGTDLGRGVLLVRRDQLGTRNIIVTSADKEKLFGELRAPVLVVARPMTPSPDLIGRG